jgi:serine/threonine protein kinase
MMWREGEKIGQYEIISQLGQGGMATVYKAHHAQLDRYVAIKVMHQTIQADEAFVARFKREAQIVASLTHPHIVPVYDFSDYNGQPYLVMKYVEGVTLKQRMIKTAMTLDDVLYVMRAVGSALTYAHSKGVLHRDVKPSNIVIDKDNVPYLADFGLARITQAGESTLSADMLLGTPNYMSPEQASGKKNLDGRTDIYSLGIVLYELLVGHVPFSGDTPYAVIHDHIYTPLPSPSKINPEIPLSVESVLLRATSKKPDDRYTTADDMIRDLDDAITESKLIDLNPDRASIASESLAQFREEMGSTLSLNQATPTALLSSATPKTRTPTTPLTLSGYKTATLYEPQAGGRWWMMGGCAGFLVIFFMSLAVLLGASNNLLELSEIWQRSQPRDMLVGMNPLSAPFIEAGVSINSEMGIALYNIPPLPQDFAKGILEEVPEEATSYLLYARSVWETDTEESYATIQQGKQYADNLAVYFSSAAQIADEVGDYDAAIAYMILSLYEARNDSELQTAMRANSGEYLYNTIAKTNNLNLGNTYTEIGVPEMYPAAEFEAIGNLPQGFIIAAYSRILEGNPLLALGALNRIPEAESNSPEVLLVRAELALSREADREATRILQSLEANDAAPDWIQDRAEDLLKEHNLE